MAIEQDISQIYRRVGVRLLTQLGSPKMFDLSHWAQPKRGIYHYVPFDAMDLGPDRMWTPVRCALKPPYYKMVGEYTRLMGGPKVRPAVQYRRLELNYLREHGEFRRVLDVEKAMTDKQIALVMDYSHLHLGWKYVVNQWTRWNMFINLFGTVFDNIARLCKESDRQHYVFIPMPDALPTRSNISIAIEDANGDTETVFQKLFRGASDELRMVLDHDAQKAPPETTRSYEEAYSFVAPWMFMDDDGVLSYDAEIGTESFDELPLSLADGGTFNQSVPVGEHMTTAMLRHFVDDRMLFVEELHRWLAGKREDSVFSALRQEDFGKINLVFTEMGKYSMVNMGLLDSWRQESPETVEGVPYPALAKRIESFYRSLMSLRSVADPLRILSPVNDLGAVPDTNPLNVNADVVTASPVNTVDSAPIATTGGSVANVPAMAEIAKVSPELAVTKPATAMGAVAVKPMANMATQIPVEEEPADEPAPATSASDLQGKHSPVPEEIHPLTRRMYQETEQLLRRQAISNAERRRFLRLSESFKTIQLGNETLEQAATVPKETVWDFKAAKVPDVDIVPDKSMLESTTIDYDAKYVREVYHRDVARMLLSVQKGPVAITGMSREKRRTVASGTVDYTVKLTPARGASTTWRMRLPDVDENGKFMMNGVRYFARKLKTDRPIRKISGSEVALSTYYPNKVFVTRSARAAYDYGAWLTSNISKSLLSDNPSFTNVVYGNTYRAEQPVPRAYSAIAREYVSFDHGGWHWMFNYPKLVENFPQFKEGNIPVAVNAKGKVLTMDKYSQIWDGETSKPIEAYFEFGGEPPREAITMTVLDKDVPLGIALAYLYGLRHLIEVIGEPLRKRIRGSRRDTTADEWELTFADEVWVFPRNRTWKQMVWSGFSTWKEALKEIPVASLWNRDGYFMLFHKAGCTARHLTELETLDDYFVDPANAEVLEEMKVPTEFTGLVGYAATLLENDDHLHEQNTAASLYRGYERFAGAAYREWVRGYRQFSNSRNPTRAGININPYAVQIAIQEDPSVSLVEDSNPIRNVKEKENVTTSGTGGRSKLSQVRRHRAFHESDVGIRSEGNVDSGDVGINYYLVANPNYTSLRGTVQGLDPKTAPVTKLLSSAGNVAVFNTYDDPKRAGFFSIQQEHVISADGYQPALLSTGYDVALAYKVDPLFATMAKLDGKVTEVDAEHLTVQYVDGSTQVISIGRQFGTVTGHTVPHLLETRLKPGERFKAGAALAFNSGFMEPDYRNLSQVRLKTGVPAYVLFTENNDNFEDSSRITESFAAKMGTNTSHIRVVTMRFDQFPVDMLKVGTQVDTDTVVMEISDDLSESVRAQGTGARSMLIDIGQSTPRMKEHGTLERIECLYFGDKEAMHPKLREIVNRFDSRQAKLHRLHGDKVPKNCQVDEPLRVQGNPLDINQVAFKFFVTDKTAMGDGDKMVVANQLKTVITGIIPGKFETVEEVFKGRGPQQGDADFSYRGEQARIVNSPILMGIGSLCQEGLGYELADTYFSK